MEEMEPTNFCTYCPNNPGFEPKRVLLRRLVSLMKHVSVVSTLHANIYHWWNLGLSAETVDPKTPFSAMNKWTQWRRAFRIYGTPCVVAKRLLGVAGARVVYFG